MLARTVDSADDLVAELIAVVAGVDVVEDARVSARDVL